MSANFSSFDSFNKSPNFSGSGLRKLAYIAGGFFLLLVLLSTFKTVPAGHRAVADVQQEDQALLHPRRQRDVELHLQELP